MLYLNPPYHIIRGVTVYRDHADPQQFYYLPAMPHLTTNFDPVTGQDVPEISLLKFTGEAGSGGFLTFSVNLGVSEDVLDEIATELRTKENLDDKPRMAPVILEDGQVRLIILGKKSAEPTPPGGAITPPPPPAPDDTLMEFVLKIEHFAKPSLYGDNQAIFSVQLDQYGVTLIEQALKGELMPIGVVYSLEFLALRPAYHVKVVADWNRVQNHLAEKFSVNALFFSSEVDEVVDKLVEDQVIDIQVDTFIPEGEDSSGVLARRDEAIRDLKDMVLDNFFKPSLNPITEEKDGWDRFADTTERLHNIATKPATGGLFSVGFSKVDITRIDQKSLNVNMSERTTVRRHIYPQANLKGLFRLLRDAAGNIDLSRFVTPVNLDDDFFKRRKVHVINRADFANDKINSINVTLRYGSEPKNVLLDATKIEGSVNWGSILQNNKMVREVFFSYRVNFKGLDSAERPAALQSPEMVFTGDDLEINPRADDLYHISNVDISAKELPWDSYRNVEVSVAYDDPANQIRQEDTFLLDKDNATATWPHFLRDRTKDSFRHRRFFRLKDGRTWLQDWTVTDEQRVPLEDPLPRKLQLKVVPAVNWDITSMVFIDLTYRDEPNGILKEDSFVFDSTVDGKKLKVFTVDRANPELSLVNFQIKILQLDNSLIELPPSMTREKEIFIRSDMRGHRVIAVQPEQVDFAARKVAELKVDLKYEDIDFGLSFAKPLIFTSQADRGFFEFDYIDPQKDSYTFQQKIIFTDGFSVTRDPQSASGDTLIIPVQ